MHTLCMPHGCVVDILLYSKIQGCTLVPQTMGQEEEMRKQETKAFTLQNEPDTQK